MEKKYFQKIPFNFGAIRNQDFKMAKIVILPIPYDLTTSWTKKIGQREGPYAIISASRQLDEIDNSFPVFTFEEIELSQKSPEDSLKGVENIVKEILKENKIPFLLGGEHSIAIGGVKALKEKYSNLSVLQLDAHPDLLDESVGNKYGHASVMRRIREFDINTCQVGLRSFDSETEKFIKKEGIKNIFKALKIPTKKIINSLTKNVYLTIDLDVFDPSIMPSVQNPVPGGLGWYEVLDLIEKVAKNKKIVGADVVELCPIPGFVAPDLLAAKLVYKIISYILK